MQEIGKVGGPVPFQQPASVEKTDKKAKPESPSSVAKSGAVINVAELIKGAKEAPEIREKLVEEIRKALDQNIYNIDPERVAKHILREL